MLIFLHHQRSNKFILKQKLNFINLFDEVVEVYKITFTKELVTA